MMGKKADVEDVNRFKKRYRPRVPEFCPGSSNEEKRRNNAAAVSFSSPPHDPLNLEPQK